MRIIKQEEPKKFKPYKIVIEIEDEHDDDTLRRNIKHCIDFYEIGSPEYKLNRIILSELCQ